jgi:hypothetical protein
MYIKAVFGTVEDSKQYKIEHNIFALIVKNTRSVLSISGNRFKEDQLYVIRDNPVFVTSGFLFLDPSGPIIALFREHWHCPRQICNVSDFTQAELETMSSAPGPFEGSYYARFSVFLFDYALSIGADRQPDPQLRPA